ncbi:MAG: Cell division protein FtsI [Peptidoglycan synthetase] [Ignavibacteriae bacterium]|nr:MAG: Cell division protein FtsI [Peptidoglycan synthetase] [Ignavibacteriota bacterium]
MYDRNGNLIVDNRPAYTVTVVPAEFDTTKLKLLSDILAIDQQELMNKINREAKYNKFAPAKVKRDVDFKTLSFIEENHEELPGVDYIVESKRAYPPNIRGSHIFGYLREISDEQLAKAGDLYRRGDIIGATGIEAQYEKYLRGEKGYNLIIVDSKGKMIGSYNDGKDDKAPLEGDDLELTIDAKVQALAESLLSNFIGAVVAIDPRDGGIIALVSKPDFNLDLLSGVTPVELWKSLIEDKNKPLFNRATLTNYPPGSTFKMILAIAALQEKFIDQNYRINCTGAFRFGNKIFKDLHVHGSTNVIEAIQRSCNVFFYQMMLKVGLDKWSEYAGMFGFGKPTGIDIMEENAGLLPSETYYNRVYGEGKWTLGYTVSLGIGQGELGVSPIQLASYAMALANQGKLYKPHVVNKIKFKKSGEIKKLDVQYKQIELHPEVWKFVREGLYRAVNLPGGTGAAARVPGVNVAGKTGTAQNPHGKDHAWFIGFAPYEDPKIAICVLVENVGFGGVYAAPIAGLCIEQYLYGEIIRNKQPKITLTKTDLEHTND